jgi:hypothetical protein
MSPTNDAQPTRARATWRSRDCVFLAIGIAAVLATGELISSFLVPRISRIESRTELERAQMLAGSRASDGRKMVVLGNSLLLEGVDFPALSSALAPDVHSWRWVIEQTQYLDWYYGLRRLYAEGLQADVVVLALDAGQMTDSGVRGEYFAQRMMMASDTLNVARDARLSLTATCSLFIGRISAYYGYRSETRKVVLARLIPGILDLRNVLIQIRRPALEHEETVDLSAQRLRQYDSLVRAHGGRFVFVVPAALDSRNGNYLQEAGARAGVPVLVPLEANAVTAADFRDGYHLTPQGASRYTASLSAQLRKVINDRVNR